MQQRESRTAQVAARAAGIGLAAAAMALTLTAAPAQAAGGIQRVTCKQGQDDTYFMFAQWEAPASCYRGSGDIDVYLGPWSPVSIYYSTGPYSGTFTYKEFGDPDGQVHTLSFSPHQEVSMGTVPIHLHID